MQLSADTFVLENATLISWSVASGTVLNILVGGFRGLSHQACLDASSCLPVLFVCRSTGGPVTKPSLDRLAWNISLNHRAYSNVQQTITRIKLDTRILDRLYLRSFIQKDNYLGMGQWNTLLQYEFFAGSNVYVVLNQEGEKFEHTGKYFKVGYEFGL